MAFYELHLFSFSLNPNFQFLLVLPDFVFVFFVLDCSRPCANRWPRGNRFDFVLDCAHRFNFDFLCSIGLTSIRVRSAPIWYLVHVLSHVTGLLAYYEVLVHYYEVILICMYGILNFKFDNLMF